MKDAKLHIRDMLAVNAAKAAGAAGRLAGRSGTSLPGKAALTIAPRVLSDLAEQVRNTVFAVCGTNGKTTVNNLLCAMLEAQGYAVVCNRLGANMLNGVVAAFADAADHTGRLHADFACLEVDEASARKVFPCVRPDWLILTNLFRDQLDRYGEIDMIMEKLEEAICTVPDLKLIVNADDPLSVFLAKKTGHPFICYGIEKNPDAHSSACAAEESTYGDASEIREGRFCKNCGALLQYDTYYYSQMGLWHCPACGFSRPVPAHPASGIATDRGLSFCIDGHPVRCSMRGLYNVYNILAVWSALWEAGQGNGMSGETGWFQRELDAYHPQFGRSEHFQIGGNTVLLNLAKNPAGFNQNISAVLEDTTPKDLLIAINDNAQDGTDVSWLWDVDFDRLREESVRSVTVSGIRAQDMRLRLKYVDIPSDLCADPEEAIEKMLQDGCGNLYVLVNYTALFPIHRYLKKRETS